MYANKRGSRHATAWGISVSFALAFAVPIYLVDGRLAKPAGPPY